MTASPEVISRRIWFIVLALAVLWHLLVFLVPWKDLLFTPSAYNTPVEVNTITADQLKQLRQQWQKSVLISKNQTASDKAPDNARFMSDRNIRVEKEQRAKQTDVLPTPQSQPANAETAPPNYQSRAKLSRLGIPYHLNRKPPDPQYAPFAPTRPTDYMGGDQAVDDKRLPYGAENMLNAEQSVYYTFYSRMYQAIGPIWQSKVRSAIGSRGIAAGDYLSQVDVVLDPDGRVVQVNFSSRSGVPEFDKAVEDAWFKIGRFPNPPKEHIQPDGYLHTGWSFRVDLAPGAGGMGYGREY